MLPRNLRLDLSHGLDQAVHGGASLDKQAVLAVVAFLQSRLLRDSRCFSTSRGDRPFFKRVYSAYQSLALAVEAVADLLELVEALPVRRVGRELLRVFLRDPFELLIEVVDLREELREFTAEVSLALGARWF
jgi:hypothetical protein